MTNLEKYDKLFLAAFKVDPETLPLSLIHIFPIHFGRGHRQTVFYRNSQNESHAALYQAVPAQVSGPPPVRYKSS